MKNLVCTFLMVFLSMSLSTAQEIKSEHVRGNNYNYYQNEQSLKIKDMVGIMENSPLALEQIKSARRLNTTSILFGFGGGWVLGRQIGKAISDNYTDALIDEIAIGAGLIGLGLIIQSRAKKRVKIAVDLYNQPLPPEQQLKQKMSVGFSSTSNGLGLVVNF